MARAKEQPVSPIDNLADRSTDEGLQALCQRQTALVRRAAAHHRRKAELDEKLLQAQRVSNIDRFADELMGDPDASLREAQSFREELEEVIQSLSGIRLAIERGEREIQDYEAQLDADDCRAVAPMHRRNVRDTFNATLRLHRSIVQQENLRRFLELRGVQRTGHLRPFWPWDYQVGLTDSNSLLSSQLRELVEWKMVSEDERVSLLQGRSSELDLEA